MIDSHEETVNPEVLEQIQKIAAQVETLFEKNPEKHEAVLLSVQNLADSLLQDSSYSRKLYEAIDARQAKRLEKAQTGSQRSEIINFYTKVMTWVAKRTAILMWNHDYYRAINEAEMKKQINQNQIHTASTWLIHQWATDSQA
jgi:hypothetical protein